MLHTTFPIVAFFYFLAVAADFVTTRRALRLGLKEGHPFLALFGKYALHALTLLGGGAGVFAVVVTYLAPNPNERIAFWFLLGFGAFRALVVVNNIFKIRRANKR